LTDTRQEELTIKLGAWSNLNQMTKSLSIMTSDNLTIDLFDMSTPSSKSTTNEIFIIEVDEI
jgi:hypothetical protein